MLPPRLALDAAADLCRTGDLWLFRGRTPADRAIQTATNAPVNHVGMVIAVEDLPPLLWHAELGRSLLDLWTGTHHRGAALHDLRDAVRTWGGKYGQRAWLRQLDPAVRRDQEDAALRTVGRLAGTPFPTTAGLAARWLSGRVPPALARLRRRKAAALPATPAVLESAYCAEIVALTYVAMGLLPQDRPASWYDPGSFWSGDELTLLDGARLGEEIAVDAG